VLSEAVRMLHDGERYQLIKLQLSCPEHRPRSAGRLSRSACPAAWLSTLSDRSRMLRGGALRLVRNGRCCHQRCYEVVPLRP
jgi:hypothetical protein